MFFSKCEFSSNIKKQNIGFDIHGNVKVFDFGLAKSLREDRLSHGNYYNLTANVGSIPYMAPEVALGKPYNEKCDVFSFGILMYEIMSLRSPFSKAIMKNYIKLVVKEGKRLCIKEGWPSMTKVIMKSSWMSSPCIRPRMEKICMMIKMDLQELEIEDDIASGINHNANISRHISNRISHLIKFNRRN
jgi:serine/threonine protein kinase